jgi:hypothetical protein
MGVFGTALPLPKDMMVGRVGGARETPTPTASEVETANRRAFDAL